MTDLGVLLARHGYGADRFLDHDEVTAQSAFDLVPQGGGHPSGHRCPGESLTLRLLSETVGVLAAVDPEVSPDTADATRIPTLPRGIDRVQVEPHPPVARPGMGRGRRS